MKLIFPCKKHNKSWSVGYIRIAAGELRGCPCCRREAQAQQQPKKVAA